MTFKPTEHRKTPRMFNCILRWKMKFFTCKNLQEIGHKEASLLYFYDLLFIKAQSHSASEIQHTKLTSLREQNLSFVPEFRSELKLLISTMAMPRGSPHTATFLEG